MKRHFTVIILTLILGILIFVPYVSAAAPLITDEADVLTDAEEAELTALAEEISDRYCVDIAVAIVKNVPESRLKRYAADLYETSGYGRDQDPDDGDDYRDGIILVFSYFSDSERYFWLYPYDYVDYAINDSGLEYIENCMRSTDRTMYRMSEAYIEACDYLLGKAEEGEVYGERSAGKGMGTFAKIIWALIIGAIAGLITASAKTSPHVQELKSVGLKTGASDYARSDSFTLTDSRECFLYANETRTVRQTSSSSSGGRSYSGGHSSHSGHHGSSGGRGGRI